MLDLVELMGNRRKRTYTLPETGPDSIAAKELNFRPGEVYSIPIPATSLEIGSRVSGKNQHL
jgi:hypothetical protein